MNKIPENYTPLNKTMPQLDITKVQHIQYNYTHVIPPQPVSKLDETNQLLKAQLYQSNKENEDLHKQLEDTYMQMRQLNDKTSSQTLYIKQLQANLKEEEKKRQAAEDKLSKKDWTLALVSLCSAIFILAIEHWNDIYNFILSLIESLQ